MKKYMVMAALVTSLSAYAQPGSLDSSFGNNGTVITKGEGGAADLAILPNGKILVAGNNAGFVLLRYNADGTLDKSFGNKGSTYVFNSSYGIAAGLSVQKDGEIVVGGNCDGHQSGIDLSMARYDSTGRLDTTFGDTGTVITSQLWGSNDYCGGVALQPDGKILMTGSAGDLLVTVRYKPDGVLDSSFNGMGIVLTKMGIYGPMGYSVLTQPDGKMVVTGHGYSDADHKNDFILVRYKPDGSLDSSFGVGGKVYTSTDPSENLGYKAVLQPDGKIVMTGNSFANSIILVRYNTDGSLDNTFGVNGIATNTDTNSAAVAIALQPDGKLVVAGGQTVTRYNSNGTIDKSFGVNGIAAATMTRIETLTLQPDGKIVAAGYYQDYSGGPVHFAIARYLGGSGAAVPQVAAGAAAFTITPNPNTGTFTLTTAGYSGRARVWVTDAAGRRVCSLDHDFGKANKLPVTITAYPPGLYLVEVIKADGSSETLKVTKE